MDTSETYIRMVDCPEIQYQHNWQDGDVLVAKEEYEQVDGDDWPLNIIEAGTINIIHNAWRMDDKRINPSEKCVWLPHQDQLQEMIDYSHHPYYHIETLYNWIIDNQDYIAILTSMEQLWLAFVMKEKHGKVWGGEKWDSIV